jgi:ubiquinone/menaquinone biosynthesis C-methylase UbiE
MKPDPKKIQPEHKYKLDTPQRRKILPPYKTLKKSGLQKGDILADIGCGIGYFSIPAAKIVGKKGKIIAIDTSEEMLKDLRKKIKEKNIENIDIKKSLPYKFPISNQEISFTLISNVLHEIDNKPRFLKEIYRILKLDGTLCIIEFKKKDTGSNPPVKARLSLEQVKNYLKNSNFAFKRYISISNIFAMYLANKK